MVILQKKQLFYSLFLTPQLHLAARKSSVFNTIFLQFIKIKIRSKTLKLQIKTANLYEKMAKLFIITENKDIYPVILEEKLLF